MAIPDEVFESSAKVDYTDGEWVGHFEGQSFGLWAGMPVTAYDDRVDLWVNAVIAGFERDKMLVMFEDGFRFLFTASRAAIRPKKTNAIPQQEPVHPMPGDDFANGYQAAINDLLISISGRLKVLEDFVRDNAVPKYKMNMADFEKAMASKAAQERSEESQ